MDTLALLPFTSADARQQLLSDLASATETLALALARLGAAYEQLDEDTSDRLEQQLRVETLADRGAEIAGVAVGTGVQGNDPLNVRPVDPEGARTQQ